MTSNKLKAREGGSYTFRETEVFEITEEQWRGAWATPTVNNGKLTLVEFPLQTKMDNFIAEKSIFFWTIDGQLYGDVKFTMAEGVDPELLAGGWTVSLRRPGASPFSKLEGDLGVAGVGVHLLERSYDMERFLKEYLIDGSLVVELVTELRVGRSAAVKDEGRWPVTGAGPAATRAMLDFLQGGEIPGRRNMEVMARDLLHLATFYQLPDLQEAAKKALLRTLTVDTAVATLVMLDQHVSGDAAAKDEVLAFIKRNASEVVKGKDWELFVKSFPGLETEVVVAMAPAE